MCNSRGSVWTILIGNQVELLVARFTCQRILALPHNIVSVFLWISHNAIAYRSNLIVLVAKRSGQAFDMTTYRTISRNRSSKTASHSDSRNSSA